MPPYELGYGGGHHHNLIGLRFIDEHLERQIDARLRIGEHERRARFGIAEDNERGRRHRQADSPGFRLLVNGCEDFDALRREGRKQPLNGIGESVWALESDDGSG